MVFTFIIEAVSFDLLPQGVEDVLRQNGLGWQGSLLLGAYGATFDIVDDICTDAGPVNCLSSLGLHLLHPLLCVVEVREGPVEEVVGYTDLVPL